MRAMRLLLDGFGSYRERTELDFTDVDFFVLTGPTGSGKSTVIDALCFALYGTVPRWGKGNAIKNALAPSTAECRVCLVFEAAGGRWAAVRQLRRDARGNVHTKEARLDRLDDTVPPDADLAKLLEASVEQRAEGPDGVTASVTELLGIGYEHFTQCVLLPQGQFAAFLHAKPGERQDLLIELLAYSVYEQVGIRARERAKLAGAQHDLAVRRLAELGAVTPDDLAAAEARVGALDELVPQVEEAVAAIAALRERWTAARDDAAAARAALESVAALRMPADVPELAGRLTAADELVATTAAALAGADAAEQAAEAATAGLPARDRLVRWRDAHVQAVGLRAELVAHKKKLAHAEEAESVAAAALAEAVASAEAATGALGAAEQAHRAVALAATLRPGAPCPVCARPVGELPHHEVPADLDAARVAVTTARSTVDGARRAHVAAGKDSATARTAADATRRRIDEVTALLDGAPDAAEVDTALAGLDRAERTLADARTATRTARTASVTAVRRRDELGEAERRAWSALRTSRDTVAALRAPAVDGGDLRAAWNTLLAWAAQQRAALTARADELAAAETALRADGTAAGAAVVDLLAGHGVATDATRAPVDLATHRERAARDLADLRARADQAGALAADVQAHRAEREVADVLGHQLRSDGFERWLCAEALDSLVLEASATLMQLSGGQYELFRGGRNELAVIDHNDAGTQRPVHTLSGGETFQASLALALALSRQVVGLSGGRRDLNSMFLDEGFGTLDESTLDIVASTLERLAEETDCMVGIVTHVPALADRVPVQFAVSRDGATSRLRRLDLSDAG
jgi:DNA repair protein SbcC/Rad50